MNFKRHRPKNTRAGCLMCKPHKMNGETHLVKVRGIKVKVQIRGRMNAQIALYLERERKPEGQS